MQFSRQSVFTAVLALSIPQFDLVAAADSISTAVPGHSAHVVPSANSLPFSAVKSASTIAPKHSVYVVPSANGLSFSAANSAATIVSKKSELVERARLGIPSYAGNPGDLLLDSNFEGPDAPQTVLNVWNKQHRCERNWSMFDNENFVESKASLWFKDVYRKHAELNPKAFEYLKEYRFLGYVALGTSNFFCKFSETGCGPLSTCEAIVDFVVYTNPHAPIEKALEEGRRRYFVQVSTHFLSE